MTTPNFQMLDELDLWSYWIDATDFKDRARAALATPPPEPLSPAAQAVLTAFAKASDGEDIDGEWQQDDVGQLAAALRAVADQVVPLPLRFPCNRWINGYLSARQNTRAKILAIATELEGQP